MLRIHEEAKPIVYEFLNNVAEEKKSIRHSKAPTKILNFIARIEIHDVEESIYLRAK